MSRPMKHNAEFFRHDANARHNLKLRALEKRMGLEGYAIYFKFLEFLAGNDFYQVDSSKPYLEDCLPSELGCTPELWKDFLKNAIELELIVNEDGILFSPGLKERLTVLDQIRALDRKRKSKPRIETGAGHGEAVCFPDGKPPENYRKTLSKAEQTKEEEIKIKHNNTTKPEEEGSINGSMIGEEVLKMLLAEPFSFSFDKVQELLRTYEVSYVHEHLKNVKWKLQNGSRHKIDDPTAYLYSHLIKDYEKPPKLIEAEKREIAKKEMELVMLEREKDEELRKQQEQLEKEEMRHKDQLFDKLPMEEKEEIMASVYNDLEEINNWVFKKYVPNFEELKRKNFDVSDVSPFVRYLILEKRNALIPLDNTRNNILAT